MRNIFEMQNLVLLVFLFSLCIADDYIVEINQGRLNGSAHYDRKGGIFYSFQRIPYARPPIGQLRFKEPQPADPWDGILDATQTTPACPQTDYTPNPSGGEDCLYLNIYTPQFPAKTYENMKHVMVYIHGGGFQAWSSQKNLFGPEYLIPEDIILVSINYRLGILGSFNLENASLGYPGNLNMKDQVLALQWIQSNIDAFGGNPDSVTIFGQSAGSASVHYLVLSPLSVGTFHKAIMESGSALCPWALGSPNNGLLLARELNISIDNTQEMLDKLYNTSVEEINEVQGSLYNQVFQSQWGLLASPIVEQEVDGQNAFLKDTPLNIIQSGDYNHVPILIGYNDADGISFHLDYTETVRLIPGDLGIDADSQEAMELVEKMDNFYFESECFSEPIVQMYTDVWFAFPAYRTANEHLKTTNSEIYVYRFTADTQLNAKLLDPRIAHYEGAAHSDEICYMFNSTNQPIEAVEPGSVEDEAIDRLVKLWTNFAKSGNPTPGGFEEFGFEWTPINQNDFHYIDFGSSETVPGVNPDSENMRFWSEIYDEYFPN